MVDARVPFRVLDLGCVEPTVELRCQSLKRLREHLAPLVIADITGFNQFDQLMPRRRCVLGIGHRGTSEHQGDGVWGTG